MLPQEDNCREELAQNAIIKRKEAFSRPNLTHLLCHSTKRHCAFSGVRCQKRETAVQLTERGLKRKLLARPGYQVPSFRPGYQVKL